MSDFSATDLARLYKEFQRLRGLYDYDPQPIVFFPVSEEDKAKLEWDIPTMPAVNYGFWYRKELPKVKDE